MLVCVCVSYTPRQQQLALSGSRYLALYYNNAHAYYTYNNNILRRESPTTIYCHAVLRTVAYYGRRRTRVVYAQTILIA